MKYIFNILYIINNYFHIIFLEKKLFFYLKFQYIDNINWIR